MKNVLNRLRGRVGPRRGPAGPFNLDNQDRWAPRGACAVDLLARHQRINDGMRVTDVGAGNALVGKLLSAHASVEYVPYDLLPQAGVTALDVREGVPGPADVLFALGLVEYLPADDLFISRLAAACDTCVVSYVHLDETTITMSKRRLLGWERHQTADEFAADFRAAGFRLVDTDSVDGMNQIWLWRRNST